MKCDELEILYRLRDEEVWPRSFWGQRYRQFCEHISFDTRFHHFDTIVSGGDPITRTFALRALSRMAKGPILVIAPVHHNEAHTPWVFDPAVFEQVRTRFNLGPGSVLDVLKAHLDQSLMRLDVKTRVVYTGLSPVFYSGDDARLYVLRPREVSGRPDPFQSLHQAFERSFAHLPKVDEKAALIGGRFDALWYLSGEVPQKRKEIEDFSFPVSVKTPMSEAQSVWMTRLQHLADISKEKG